MKAIFKKLSILNDKTVKLIETNKRLLKANEDLRRKNKTLIQKIRRQAKKSKSLTRNEVFEGAKLYLNENSLILLNMKLRHQNVKRKWNEDENYFALSLYYKSPKEYKFLRLEKNSSLPCLSLIKEWVNELTLSPGINTYLFKFIKSKADSMDDYEK